MKINKAAYLGSFDPMTNGHLDIIERASYVFNGLIIGVGKHHRKSIHFSIEDRIEMLKDSCKHLKNIEVLAFDGLAVDFAKKNNITVMIRGLRTEADYVYEMQMAMMNRSLDKKIDTFFIPTRQDLSHISSTLVREVAQLKGDISELVPNSVKTKLKSL